MTLNMSVRYKSPKHRSSYAGVIHKYHRKIRNAENIVHQPLEGLAVVAQSELHHCKFKEPGTSHFSRRI